jgi:hypothetical protein
MLSYQDKNPRTVNYLRTIYFDHPDWTPCRVSLMPATWMKYGEQLEELVLRHPRLFPDFRAGEKDYDAYPDVLYEPGQHTDCWGSVWDNVAPGLSSIVIHEPLTDWETFEAWTAPDPLTEAAFGPRDWEAVALNIAEAKARGDVASRGDLQHGFMYMRLYYLRGFENLMFDIATDDPRLQQLIDIVLDYNATVVATCVELGAEQISLGDDLGLQKSLPIHPTRWRQLLKPCYETIYEPCRDRDLAVRMHSDGHILEIIPDLVDAGVRVINPQIRANGLAGLQEIAKGKVAIDIDLDRQLFPFASPDEIRAHITQVYQALHQPEGGLLLHAECEPDVPLENIEAICATLEEVASLPDPDL